MTEEEYRRETVPEHHTVVVVARKEEYTSGHGMRDTHLVFDTRIPAFTNKTAASMWLNRRIQASMVGRGDYFSKEGLTLLEVPVAETGLAIWKQSLGE
jgi:hypothetical protein